MALCVLAVEILVEYLEGRWYSDFVSIFGKPYL